MNFLLLLVAPFLFGPTKVSSPILNTPAGIARKENKIMFVHFTASWCGWCKRMEKVLANPPVQPIWERQFVDVPVVVDESPDKVGLNTPGGNELRTMLHGDKQGIPFFAFVKPDGTVLADSFMKPGQNLGCPAQPEEIASFVEKLRGVALKLSSNDLNVIRKAFESAK